MNFSHISHSNEITLACHLRQRKKKTKQKTNAVRNLVWMKMPTSEVINSKTTGHIILYILPIPSQISQKHKTLKTHGVISKRQSVAPS